MLDENTVDLIAVSKYEFKDLDNLYNIPKKYNYSLYVIINKIIRTSGVV